MAAIRRFHVKPYRNIILLFIVYFGFTMVMSPGMDGYQHAQQFMQIGSRSVGFLGEAFQKYLTLEEYNDIYIYITSFFISRITLDPRWFFAFNALVFGWLYLKTLGYIYDEFDRTKISSRAFLFFFICVVLISVNHIHFVRFWIAAWLFIYCTYLYLVKGKRTVLLLSMLSVLIHFSFFLPVLLLLIYSLIGRNPLMIFIYLVLVVSFTGIYFDNLLSLASSAGGGIAGKVEGYTNEEYVLRKIEMGASANWYVLVRGKLLKYYLFTAFLASLLLFQLKRDVAQNRLIGFILVYLVTIITIAAVSDVGSLSRFEKILHFFLALYFYRLLILNPSFNPRVPILIGVPIVLLYAVVEIRATMYLASPLQFIGNGLAVFFEQWDFVLRDIM